jgi:gamma-glutamylcyclotransferase (GGCT)/AIG2-like uncharacterized protein YtfP
VPQETDLVVFVYGSLQPGGRNWARFCAGKVVAQQPARVRGTLYRQRDGFPALTLDEQWWAHGWRLELRDPAALAGFDRLEDYSADRPPEKNDYQRVRTECFALEDESGSAPLSLGPVWIYIMTAARLAEVGAVVLASEVWLEPQE